MSLFFGPLIEWLKCLLLFLVGCLEWLAITVINLLILALAGLEALAIALLPEVSLPSITWPSFFAEANYFLPLSQALLALGIVVPVLLLWPLVRFILNWAKGD
jgi:hypothetical protein